jgi:hypothetical protein
MTNELTKQQEDDMLEEGLDLARDMNGHCPHIHKDDPHWAICQECWVKEHTKK